MVTTLFTFDNDIKCQNNIILIILRNLRNLISNDNNHNNIEYDNINNITIGLKNLFNKTIISDTNIVTTIIIVFFFLFLYFYYFLLLSICHQAVSKYLTTGIRLSGGIQLFNHRRYPII